MRVPYPVRIFYVRNSSSYLYSFASLSFGFVVDRVSPGQGRPPRMAKPVSGTPLSPSWWGVEGIGLLIYRKDSKKSFGSERGAGLFLVIKVHCFYVNFHSFWHALFHRDSVSIQDHFFRQHTGQASLAATISFLWTQTRETSIKLKQTYR